MLRPGGRMALLNWSDSSAITRIVRTTASYLPAPPAFVDPPWLWGSEQHVRGLFAGTGIELEFERGVAEFPPFDSVDDDIEYHSARFGPLLAARADRGRRTLAGAPVAAARASRGADLGRVPARRRPQGAPE